MRRCVRFHIDGKEKSLYPLRKMSCEEPVISVPHDGPLNTEAAEEKMGEFIRTNVGKSCESA